MSITSLKCLGYLYDVNDFIKCFVPLFFHVNATAKKIVNAQISRNHSQLTIALHFIGVIDVTKIVIFHRVAQQYQYNPSYGMLFTLPTTVHYLCVCETVYLGVHLTFKYLQANGKGTNSMHFLHMMEPHRRQWWRRFLMLNLPPQSGQKGTSESFTQDTTDFSRAKE